MPADQPPFNVSIGVPLNIKNGLTEYNGQTLTYYELMNVWNLEDQARCDWLETQRDPASDNQNIWGRKIENFIDDWYYRKRPLRRFWGYPKDLGFGDYGGPPQYNLTYR